jgi:hypothetical protein
MDNGFEDKRISDIKKVWQSLFRHMRERNLRPFQISEATGYRIDHIEQGLAGELVPVTYPFIYKLVIYLGLVPTRAGHYKDKHLPTYDQCVELLELPEEPPQQNSLWDT